MKNRFKMMTILSFAFIMVNLHQALTTPMRQLKEPKHQTISEPTHHATLTAHHPNMITTRQKKSQNTISLPIQHYLIPNLHVLPAQSSVRHSSVHTDIQHYITNDNVKIPVLTQTVSHSSSNITHPSPSMPLFMPISHNFVPLQDLSVIPLQKSSNLGHYRAMVERKDDDGEVNRFRTFYGGYGTGLFFGGHGAGHGFHIFG